MSDFFVGSGLPLVENYGAITGSTLGTLVSGNATAGLPGAWYELTSATGMQSSAIAVHISDPSGANLMNIDLAIGPAGSEVLIAGGLMFRADGYSRNSSMTYRLPITIPAGVRLAARVTAQSSSRTVRVIVQGFAGSGGEATYQGMGWLGYMYQVTTGYTANTKGAWVQLIASTTRPYKALHAAWALLDFSGTSNASAMIDIGVGTAGSETVIVPNLHCTGQSVSSMSNCTNHNAFIHGGIPAGVSLSGRVQVSAGVANRHVGLFVWGYY